MYLANFEYISRCTIVIITPLELLGTRCLAPLLIPFRVVERLVPIVLYHNLWCVIRTNFVHFSASTQVASGRLREVRQADVNASLVELVWQLSDHFGTFSEHKRKFQFRTLCEFF